MSPQTASTNEALTPVSNAQRVFRWHDHASLWFSLGVGLLVMQVGAYLMPEPGCWAGWQRLAATAGWPAPG